jgi:hypothetical protein
VKKVGYSWIIVIRKCDEKHTIMITMSAFGTVLYCYHGVGEFEGFKVEGPGGSVLWPESLG